MVPLDSVKGTLRLSLSLLLYLLGRCCCLDHRLRPCVPTSGRTCSLIFCLNHLTHRWLKRPLVLDFRKSVTSSCREGADTHLLTTALSSPARSPQLPHVLLEASCQWSQGAFGLGGGTNCLSVESQGPAPSRLHPCAARCWIWRGCGARHPACSELPPASAFHLSLVLP